MHETMARSYAHDPQSEYDLDDLEKRHLLNVRIRSWFPVWHEKAQCRNSDIEGFFGRNDEKGRGTITLVELRKAKRICAKCDVFTVCLRTALCSREKFGVWGGTSGRTRTRILGMIDRGEVTMEQVLADYAEGKTEAYENPWGMNIEDEEDAEEEEE